MKRHVVLWPQQTLLSATTRDVGSPRQGLCARSVQDWTPACG